MSYFQKLYENGELPHRAKLVYLYLHDRMDKERKAWPGIKTIAADLSLSRSTGFLSDFRVFSEEKLKKEV